MTHQFNVTSLYRKGAGGCLADEQVKVVIPCCAISDERQWME